MVLLPSNISPLELTRVGSAVDAIEAAFDPKSAVATTSLDAMDNTRRPRVKGTRATRPRKIALLAKTCTCQKPNALMTAFKCKSSATTQWQSQKLRNL
jgi:hypothetical protein